MSTVADKLRAEGVPLELGGEWVVLKFTNRALAEIEKRFGSCLAFEAKLNDALGRHVGGPIFTVCLEGLAAALISSRSRWPEDRIDAVLDPTRLTSYLEALLAAWDQAWPKVEAGNDPGNAEGTPESDSPGSPIFSSPSSTSAGPQMSSGI